MLQRGVGTLNAFLSLLSKTLPGASPGHGPHEQHAISSLTYETQTTAVLTAMTTGGLIAASRGAAGFNLSQAVVAMPPDPIIFPRLIDTIRRVDSSEEALSTISDLYIRLTTGRRMLSDLHLASRTAPAPAALKPCVEIWTSLCSHAICAVYAVESLANDVGKNSDTISHQAVAILRAAQAGERPSLGAGGALAMPPWLQRRQHQRFVVNMCIELSVADRVQFSVACDISRSGIGIKGVAGVRPGDSADVRFRNGRVLTGNIIWTTQGRAGMNFDRLLENDDPLLRI